jgi:hypothetical protein
VAVANFRFAMRSKYESCPGLEIDDTATTSGGNIVLVCLPMHAKHGLQAEAHNRFFLPSTPKYWTVIVLLEALQTQAMVQVRDSKQKTSTSFGESPITPFKQDFCSMPSPIASGLKNKS